MPTETIPLKPNDPLITLPMWGHMTVWKTYIFLSTRIMSAKVGCSLEGGTSARKFLSYHQLLVFFFLANLGELAKVGCRFFHIC